MKPTYKDQFNRIRFHIVSVFLLLMVSSSVGIILFNYHQTQNAVRDTSISTIKEVGRGVVNSLNGIVEQTRTLTSTTEALITKPEDIGATNKPLVAYLLDILVQNPLLTSINTARANGDLLSVSNLGVTKQQHYIFSPEKPLPGGCIYAIRTIVHTGTLTNETLEYRNNILEVVDTEKNSFATEDPRRRPWYTTVATWPHVGWIGPYDIAPNVSGITVSVPIVINQEVVGVIGSDLALEGLSTLIAHTVIGKNGRAFVLDDGGKIILPMEISGSLPSVVQAGYNEFLNTQTKSFILKAGDQSHVIDFFLFPFDNNMKWWVVTIVPFSDFFGPILETQIESIQMGGLILFLFAFLIYFAAGRIATPINRLAGEVELIKNFDFSERPLIKSTIYEISLLAYSIQTMRKAFASFMRYIPKEIVKQFLQQDQAIVIGGQRRDMTILFSDIENFTTISEDLTVEQITTALTEYFEAFTKIIVQHEGTIDKYIGDSVMALWNAPNEVVRHAEKACEACLDFIAYTKNIEIKNPFLRGNTRFGLNTGEVIVGNIGTTERVSYTAIGTVVNTASRFQTLNKAYGSSIIIGESLREKISHRFVTRPLDFIAVKGRKQSIQIHELMGISEGEPKACLLTPEQIEMSKNFADAFYLFHKNELAEAKKKFSAILEKHPSDVPTKLHLARIEEVSRYGSSSISSTITGSFSINPIIPPQNPPQNPPDTTPKV